MWYQSDAPLQGSVNKYLITIVVIETLCVYAVILTKSAVQWWETGKEEKPGHRQWPRRNLHVSRHDKIPGVLELWRKKK